MRIVIRVEDLTGFTEPPPDVADHGDDAGTEWSDDPGVLGNFWGMLLAFAVKDNATSVHYHPWRADGGLAYVVANVRYVMCCPPDDFAAPIVARARSLFTRPARGRWLGRGVRGGSACGTVELDVWGHWYLWDAVVWSSGERTGVDLFRIAPAVREPGPAERGAAADPRRQDGSEG